MPRLSKYPITFSRLWSLPQPDCTKTQPRASRAAVCGTHERAFAVFRMKARKVSSLPIIGVSSAHRMPAAANRFRRRLPPKSPADERAQHLGSRLIAAVLASRAVTAEPSAIAVGGERRGEPRSAPEGRGRGGLRHTGAALRREAPGGGPSFLLRHRGRSGRGAGGLPVGVPGARELRGERAALDLAPPDRRERVPHAAQVAEAEARRVDRAAPADVRRAGQPDGRGRAVARHPRRAGTQAGRALACTS